MIVPVSHLLLLVSRRIFTGFSNDFIRFSGVVPVSRMIFARFSNDFARSSIVVTRFSEDFSPFLE